MLAELVVQFGYSSATVMMQVSDSDFLQCVSPRGRGGIVP